MFPNENTESQHRTSAKVFTIKSDSHDFEMRIEEDVEITPNGNVKTTESHTVIEQDGEMIKSINQIVGSCVIENCGKFLTKFKVRICHNIECQKVLCNEHSRLDKKNNVFYCTRCMSKLRRKRFLYGCLRILLSPFVERVE